MEIQLFGAMRMTIPDGFEIAGVDERKAYFGATLLDYAYLHQDKGAAIGVVRTGTQLTDKMVESQIAAYQQHYSRMVPGFSMGEMRKSNELGREIAFMTYKSNAPTKDLFNILAITTLEEQEIVFLFSCDMQDAVRFMYQFLSILDSLTFTETNSPKSND